MPGDATKVDEVTHEGNRSRTRLWVGMILLGALVAAAGGGSCRMR